MDFDDVNSHRSNLLILRGVYPQDFNHRAEKPHHSSSRLEILPVYTEIPTRFVSTGDWLRFSNLKCWSCDSLPVSYPKFIPINLEKNRDGEDVCDVHGHFCEWNCAVRYVITEFPKEQQWDALQAICLFESKFSGKRREKIVPAPSKTCMKQYCGNGGISQKQYKDKIVQLNQDYDLSLYKLCHFTESQS